MASRNSTLKTDNFDYHENFVFLGDPAKIKKLPSKITSQNPKFLPYQLFYSERPGDNISYSLITSEDMTVELIGTSGAKRGVPPRNWMEAELIVNGEVLDKSPRKLKFNEIEVVLRAVYAFKKFTPYTIEVRQHNFLATIAGSNIRGIRK